MISSYWYFFLWWIFCRGIKYCQLPKGNLLWNSWLFTLLIFFPSFQPLTIPSMDVLVSAKMIDVKIGWLLNKYHLNWQKIVTNLVSQVKHVFILHKYDRICMFNSKRNVAMEALHGQCFSSVCVSVCLFEWVDISRSSSIINVIGSRSRSYIETPNLATWTSVQLGFACLRSRS